MVYDQLKVQQNAQFVQMEVAQIVNALHVKDTLISLVSTVLI